MLFAETDPVFDLRFCEIIAVRYGILVALFESDQGIDTVQRHTAVITNNAATPISIRKAGKDLVVACTLDTCSIYAENTVIVGFAVPRENLLDLRIRLLACLNNSLLYHTPAAVRHHSAFARDICLKSDNNVILVINVSGRESINIRRRMRIYIIHTLPALYCQIFVIKLLPQMAGLFRGRFQE